MRLLWMYEMFFKLPAWAEDVWTSLSTNFGDLISRFLVESGSPISLPSWLYYILDNFTLIEFIIGSGLGVWLVITLITWITHVVN